jgi:hypothetical protein
MNTADRCTYPTANAPVQVKFDNGQMEEGYSRTFFLLKKLLPGSSINVWRYTELSASETHRASRPSSSRTPPKPGSCSVGQASFLGTMMECEICGAEADEQPVRIVDSRKDPDRTTNKPPPRRYAVAIVPYRCPKCGHEQYRRGARMF